MFTIAEANCFNIDIKLLQAH